MLEWLLVRILLISDIHANLLALDAVLGSVKEYDEVWCLGDVVGYGPAPNECIERLKELEPVCLAGNHDWATLGKLDIGEFNSDARRAIEWTQSILKTENRDWLLGLPEIKLLSDDDLLMVHGSPRHPIWEYVLSSSVAAENMPYFQTSCCLFGHTHVPALFYQPAGKGQVAAQRLTGEKTVALGRKMLVNPGSVGQPRDRDPRAAFAMIDLGSGTLSYRRIPYDIAGTQEAMVKANLPRRLVERLEYGV